MLQKVFNESTGDVTWGSIAAATDGTYLIDDEEVGTLVTSDSVKGEQFSYMLFGHIQNAAERLVLERVRALFRPTLGRKRRGR